MSSGRLDEAGGLHACASLSEADIRAVLNTIVDPCSRAAGATAGLVDMGLIRRLSVTADSSADDHGVDVLVVIGVTEYACLMGPSFAIEAYKKLTPMPGVRSVEVELDGVFDWDPDDMSPDYRRRLAERRAEGMRVLLPLRGAARPTRPTRPTPESNM